MSELNRDSGARTLTSEQLDRLFHSPALRRLFQENASDEYALIWLLSKHTKDSGSEKIYLKDMVKELNLPCRRSPPSPAPSRARGWSAGPTTAMGRTAPISFSPTPPSPLSKPTGRPCGSTTSGWCPPLGRSGSSTCSARSPSWRKSYGRKPRKWGTNHEQTQRRNLRQRPAGPVPAERLHPRLPLPGVRREPGAAGRQRRGGPDGPDQHLQDRLLPECGRPAGALRGPALLPGVQHQEPHRRPGPGGVRL